MAPHDDTALSSPTAIVPDEGRPATRRAISLLPPLAAAVYPFLLMLFHALAGASGAQPSAANGLGAALTLACAFGVPVLALAVACQAGIGTRMRRLAYASTLAPTLYVFLGVVQALAGSRIPDPAVWCVLWLAAMSWAACQARPEARPAPWAAIGSWRVAHGVSAAALCLYVFFHLANHLAGLRGPATHAAFMEAGRAIYRAPFIEPLLVLAMLFQVGSGLRLAWHWSAARHDFFRTFQIASGVYLSIFILGHMNSVFIYARTWLGIPTDWNFAIGAPTGLIHDPWNIRLLPHYALGVFLVLGHLVAGLRVVLKAHGVGRPVLNRVWFTGIAISGLIAIAIIAGMCGVRI